MNDARNIPPMAIGGFDYIARAVLVDFVKFRVAPDASGPGTVNHVRYSLHGLSKAGWFANAALAQFNACEVRLNESPVAGLAQQHSNLQPSRPQAVEDVTAHKTGRAGEEYFHGCGREH